MRRMVVAAAALACCTVLLGGCVMIPVGPASSSSGVNEPAQPSANGTANKKTAKLSDLPAGSGVTLKSGALSVTTVVEPPKATSPEGKKAPSGQAYLVLDVSFGNQTTNGIWIKPADFKLADPSGNLVTPAPSLPAFNAQSMQQLLPGYGANTAFVYLLPSGAKGYVFAYTPELPSAKKSLRWSVP